MKLAEYREHTKRTLPDLTFTIKGEGLSVRNCSDEIGHKLNLTHMVLGLAGEIKELVECVGTELKLKIDKINLGEEIGDMYWYLANYCNFQNLPLPETVVFDTPPDMCLDFLIIKIGDLVDTVKRLVAYNKPIDKAKELELVYDIRVALFMFEELYSLSGDDIREANIAKLRKRYPDKFSEDLAINRNIEEERKTLENMNKISSNFPTKGAGDDYPVVTDENIPSGNV